MNPRASRRYRTAAGRPRRQPRVRRASAGLSPIRAAAILTMLMAAGVGYGLVATSAFGFSRLDVSGTALTPEAAIRDKVGIDPGTNLVGLETEPIAARVRQLPSVRDAQVTVGLPGIVAVNVSERRPIVVWAVGDRRFAVDSGGFLFADVATDPTGQTQGMPIVIDERASAIGFAVGSTLDPVVLDAATRLGSLTPGQIGSHAATLRVHITDKNGFTISSGSGGWVAIFGFYGLSVRTTELIPGQVLVLTNLLAGREDTVESAIIADNLSGTFTPKPTPKPSPTVKP